MVGQTGLRPLCPRPGPPDASAVPATGTGARDQAQLRVGAQDPHPSAWGRGGPPPHGSTRLGPPTLTQGRGTLGGLGGGGGRMRYGFEVDLLCVGLGLFLICVLFLQFSTQLHNSVLGVAARGLEVVG